MSALDGFYKSWENARRTFGQGTPQPGTDFDKSPQLTDLGSGTTMCSELTVATGKISSMT
ncbi:hypothetical protein [Mycolicibacterium doricum]|uniref:Uncharacterized protein n=1 Tax=Mycolicibacterium doricum TaxID=126673 RepID=A0A1X1TIN2_9MYCO|nr:hypothetical protein [Mycolicibacterium doricum]MCV7267989.1 hypothetical protein [Mycolicibacterium doricum]ORV44383.1 hypothetical protein AWC01_03680 [Mycolicibacterium doricum]